MERGRVRPAAHDRRVAHPIGAVAAESVLEDGLELVLVHPGAGGPHRGEVTRDADVHRDPQPGDFVGVLHGAHRIHDRPHVAHVGAREHEIDDAALVARGAAQRHVQRPRSPPRAAGPQQPRVEGVGRQHARYPREAGGHTVGAQAPPGPALLRGVARREEQHGVQGIGTAGGQEQPRVLCLELREIEKGVVLPEVDVLDVIRLHVALVGGRDQHGAAADPLQQRPPARGRGGDVHRAAHPGQLRHRGVLSDRRGRGRRLRRQRRTRDGGGENEEQSAHGP